MLTCDICGRKVKTIGGLKAHKRLVHAEGEVHAISIAQNNTTKKEVNMAQEEKAKFEVLLDLFKEDRRGIFQPPLTEQQQRDVDLNGLRRSIVQTMQVLIEVAALLHPERLQAVLEEFKEEPDFRRIVLLDWLDWTYQSYGQVHILDEMLVKALRKQSIDIGIIAEDEELPEAPKTKLGPVLEELASRIQPPRR